MHFFRSEEHLRNWVGYGADTESGIVPLQGLMKWFSGEMFRRRLDPDYMTKSPEYSGSFIEPLIEMGKTDSYWISPEWATGMGAAADVEESGPLSVDSTLGRLLADDKAKAVLDKHIPGISSNPQIEQAKGMSLKAIAAMSQGAITDEILKAIGEDLSKL